MSTYEILKISVSAILIVLIAAGVALVIAANEEED
jgi:hypothetical protein